MALTEEQVNEHLDSWLAADLAITAGQSYSIGDRALTKVDGKEIRENIDYWEKKSRRFDRGGPTVIGGIPVS